MEPRTCEYQSTAFHVTPRLTCGHQYYIIILGELTIYLSRLNGYIELAERRQPFETLLDIRGRSHSDVHGAKYE